MQNDQEKPVYYLEKGEYPFVNIHHIGQLLGIKVEHLEGDISGCARLEIPLKNGRTLRLQTGDFKDHYWVVMTDDLKGGI